MLDMTGNTTLARWYVARTEPRREHLAVQGLVRHDIKSYLPETFVSRRFGYRHRNVLEPIFPGYIFVRLPIYRPPWGAIRGTRGINEHRPFLTVNGDPEAVSESVMGLVHLIERNERSYLSDSDPPSFYIGKQITVRVSDRYGTVSEFPAVIESTVKLDTQGLVRVIAQWLGGSRQIEVRVAQIKAEGLHQAEMTH